MASIADLFFTARLDDGKLQIDAKRSGDKAGQTLGQSLAAGVKKSFSGQELGKGLVQGLGLAGGLGAAKLASAAVSGLSDVIGESITKASALNETMSKSSAVFGRNADEVSKWGDTAATAMGLSKQAAVEAAASFGDLFNKVGISADKSVEMSENIVGLSADLASFNNLAGGSAEALDKIKSGLAGESEPLRSLGVFLTEAKVKAEGLALGLADAHGELSEGAKIQARYSLILKETASAQGDFARTSDQLANKQRINQAKFDDALAKFGTVLLPMVTGAVGDLSDVLSGLVVVMDLLNGKLPESDDGLQSLARTIAGLTPLTGMAVNSMRELQEKEAAAAAEAARYDEIKKRLNETTAETTARLLAEGKAADDAKEPMKGLGDIYDIAAGQAGDMATALLGVAAGAAKSADKSGDAEDAAKDLEKALDDVRRAADDAARAFGDQGYDADELKGRIADLTNNLIEAKDELKKLEAIKHPTAEQQRDIDIAKGKVAEYRHNIYDSRIELAKLDKATLKGLLDELAKAQYRTDKLGDEAREALGYFQKLAFAAKNVPGYRADPGYAPRAAGGAVYPDQPYTVGERGPETFVPDTSGMILPHTYSGSVSGTPAAPRVQNNYVTVEGLIPYRDPLSIPRALQRFGESGLLDHGVMADD